MRQSIRFLLFQVLFVFGLSLNSTAQISGLKKWLKTPVAERPALNLQYFAKKPLTIKETRCAKKLLLADYKAQVKATYGKQWDSRKFVYENYEMPFFYKKFGKAPADGRSLYISLHGGGGAPAAVNDQQYNNQKRLYDATMNTLEGVYLAPRAPTNAWNLWHQGHIDLFLDLIIQLAVIKENVNPNKVYILGYSAGGDGVYQLAPRMADRWAAAAMMAGHPNNASPLNLRNTPFAINMGALDKAYNRNKVAEKWGKDLDKLQLGDPEGYIHTVKIHEGLGHWMKLKDAAALPWMSNFKRNPIPSKVVWRQSNKNQNAFYWLRIPSTNIQKNGTVVVEYNKDLNEINILENYSDTLDLFIHEGMLNLSKRVVVRYQNKVIFEGSVCKTILNLYQSLEQKGDENLCFPSMLTVVKNQLVLDPTCILRK